ncbi:MAG: hypothetical protein Hens3KO_14070 [Henriciella sp.]
MSDANITGSRQLYVDPRPVKRDEHANLGLMQTRSPYGFAAETHLVPITAGEIAEVSAHYPVVFMGEAHVPAAALSLQEGQNPFVASSGVWREGSYVPAFLRQYPFAIATAGEEDPILCVDTACDRLTEDNPDDPFFVNDEPSELLRRAMTLCQQVETDRQRTEALVRELDTLGLFTSITLRFPRIGPAEEPLSFEIKGIDHERLAQLGDKEKARLIDDGLISLIVGWQFSQRHWPTIAKLGFEAHGNSS